jgi:hypothetical protein
MVHADDDPAAAAMTVAACHTRRLEPAGRVVMSVTGVPLFTPRIAVVVTSRSLAKAVVFFVAQTDVRHPFRALPEIEMWSHPTHGSSVFGFDRITIKLDDDHRIVVQQIGDG